MLLQAVYGSVVLFSVHIKLGWSVLVGVSAIRMALTPTNSIVTITKPHTSQHQPSCTATRYTCRHCPAAMRANAATIINRNLTRQCAPRLRKPRCFASQVHVVVNTHLPLNLFVSTKDLLFRVFVSYTRYVLGHGFNRAMMLDFGGKSI
ncbi:hypothetical protein JOD55_000514 [Arcanobacterium pluranimalium]|nr:hypothetical protein [Arcanobacterium pluranimalium]